MPQSVKNYGVTVKKALAFPLLVISIKSPNGTYDSSFLSNYTTININDAIARIPGRRPDQPVRRQRLRDARLAAARRHRAARGDGPRHRERDRTAEPADARPARSAVRRRPTGTEFTYTVRTQGRLLNEEEFGNIIIRTNPNGSRGPAEGRRAARARARCSTTPSAATTASRPRSSPCSRFRAPTRSTSPDQIKAEMANLSKRFPRDMEYLVSLDTTLPVSEGIIEIVHTLFEAVGARDHRRLHLSPELARDADSADDRARSRSSARSSSSRCSASRSTCSRCSASCSPSASSWTMRSWWSKR